MSREKKGFRAVLFVALSSLAALPAWTLVACTEDLFVGAEPADAAPANGDGSNADATFNDAASDSQTDALATDAGTGADTAPLTDATTDDAPMIEDGGCGVVIAQEGALVPIQVFMDGIPAPGGGTITPGTYALTAYKVHGGGPQGTGNVRETIVITGSPTVGAIKKLGDLSDTTGDFTAHGPLGEHFTFTGSNGSPAIFQSEDCPTNDPDEAVDFTVTMAGITFVDEMTATERVYTKLR